MISVKLALGAMAIGGALAAGTMPSAHADTYSYLQALTNKGLVITNVQDAINMGLNICRALPTTNGEDLAQYLYYNNRSITSLSQARLMVIASAEELCPSQDHRQYAAAPASVPAAKHVPVTGGAGGGRVGGALG